MIGIRNIRHVAAFTALATLFATAVPMIATATLLMLFVPGMQSSATFLFVALSGVIPLFITPPIAVMALLLVQKLTLTIDRIENHVQFDLLTGALNRGHFLDRLRAAREEGILLIVDLDHFKRINDEHGHDAGDQALTLFAALLQREVGQHGLVARLGGEEFAIFLPGYSLVQGKLAAQQLCLAAAHARTIADAPHLHPTASMGGTLRKADEPIGISLKRADLALYRAKREGRNRARFDEDQQASRKAAARKAA